MAKGDIIRIEDLYEEWPSAGTGFDMRVDHLPELLIAEQWMIDLDVPYQRKHCWTDEQREAFVGYVLGGGKVLPLVINEPPRRPGAHTSTRLELVDGKQRFTSLILWLEGKIPARCGGRSIWRTQTDMRFRLCHTLHFDIVKLSEVEVLRFYLRLNAGGTPHSKSDILRVQEMLREAESLAAECRA